MYWWPGTWQVRAYPEGGVKWGQWWYLWMVGKTGEWEFFTHRFMWEDAEWPED